jgi:hypothetical protein
MPLHAQRLIDRHLRRAHRVLDREHHVVFARAWAGFSRLKRIVSSKTDSFG